MDFGNISEIVAAVAVIISIAYLAIQVRDGTQIARLAATRELFIQAQNAGAANSADDEIADIWLIGVRDRTLLSHRDGFRFSRVVYGIFSIWEQQYFHLKENSIHKELFESQLEAHQAVLIWPGIRHWWGDNGGVFSKSFRDHVENLLEAKDAIDPSEYNSERLQADA